MYQITVTGNTMQTIIAETFTWTMPTSKELYHLEQKLGFLYQQ